MLFSVYVDDLMYSVLWCLSFSYWFLQHQSFWLEIPRGCIFSCMWLYSACLPTAFVCVCCKRVCVCVCARTKVRECVREPVCHLMLTETLANSHNGLTCHLFRLEHHSMGLRDFVCVFWSTFYVLIKQKLKNRLNVFFLIQRLSVGFCEG